MTSSFKMPKSIFMTLPCSTGSVKTIASYKMGCEGKFMFVLFIACPMRHPPNEPIENKSPILFRNLAFRTRQEIAKLTTISPIHPPKEILNQVSICIPIISEKANFTRGYNCKLRSFFIRYKVNKYKVTNFSRALANNRPNKFAYQNKILAIKTYIEILRANSFRYFN